VHAHRVVRVLNPKCRAQGIIVRNHCCAGVCRMLCGLPQEGVPAVSLLPTCQREGGRSQHDWCGQGDLAAFQ
jgi:hypothetical protein